MNKLMFAVAGVAVAGSTFAMPQVFDYKSSVKHMYLKEVNVKVDGARFKIYQKYQKTASLKGYLIMDQDGVTSEKVSEGQCKSDGKTSYDYGCNRGFLVVINSSAESKVRAPKIIPAVLDAKWIDTAFAKSHAAKSGLAEGTLFLGGDSIECCRPKIDDIDGVLTDRGVVPSLPVAGGQPGMTAYADYVWTSIYLFGQFNGPNWFVEPLLKTSPFTQFEYVADSVANWNSCQPEGLRQDFNLKQDADGNWIIANYFHDCWMNGAGIGKYFIPSSETTGELCCGLTPSTVDYAPILDTLAGNLKGGLFLCTENGIDVENAAYNWFDGVAWEDQFNANRLDSDEIVNYIGDAWQNDLWQDGAVEQETTDVIFGNWSIKYNKTFFSEKKGIAKEPTAYWAALANHMKATGVEEYEEDPLEKVDEYIDCAIYGAAVKLSSNVNYYDNDEIYNTPSKTRFAVPMLTPQFIQYYGLAKPISE